MIAAAVLAAALTPIAAPALADDARVPAHPDVAAVSAGCLAAASSLTAYMPDVAATPEQIAAEGRYWTWQLRAAAPDEPDQIEHWEEARIWLDAELRARDPRDAREFLADYRGRCVVAQAQAQSEAMWEAMR